MQPTKARTVMGVVGAVGLCLIFTILFSRFDDRAISEGGDRLDGDLKGFTRNESAVIDLFTKSKATFLPEERIPEMVYRAGLRNLCKAYSTCFSCISERHCVWCSGGKQNVPKCQPKNYLKNCPSLQIDTCDSNMGRKFVVCESGNSSNRSSTYQMLESALYNETESSNSSDSNISCVAVHDRGDDTCHQPKQPVSIRVSSSRPVRKRKVISFCDNDYDNSYSLLAPAEKRIVSISERLTHLGELLPTRAGNIATNSQIISTRISDFRKKKKYVNGKVIPPVVLIGQNLKGGFALKRLRPSYCIWQTDDTQDSVTSMAHAIDEGCQAVSIVKKRSAINLASSELLSEEFVFLDPLTDLQTVFETVLNRSSYSSTLLKERDWRVDQFKKTALSYLSNNIHVVAKLQTKEDVRSGLVMAIVTLFLSPFSSIEFFANLELKESAEMESLIEVVEFVGLGKDIQITFLEDVSDFDAVDKFLSLSSLDPPPSHLMFVSDPSVIIFSVATMQALVTHLMNDPFSSLFLSDLSILFAPFVSRESQVPCMTFVSNATFLSRSQTCSATYLSSLDLYVYKRDARTKLFIRADPSDSLSLPELYQLVYLRNTLCELASYSNPNVQKHLPKNFRCDISK
eukprot:TRINITY_DN12578_c0_g1_i1.p1 TRINITY_DN12578_c0_g1~~TRINITY_DN12578_c0_g1_i1.p1  ORF type:complete len:628 (+),score=101.61 TRINITY_DN12578_c0_g1_i1:93-1976(+)